MIKFTQGDTVSLKLTATDGQGNPIDLTGATFSTTMRGFDGAVITFPNSQHTADPDQINNKGQFVLALSSTDTNNVPAGINKEIITLITIGLTQINYRGPNILTVVTAIPVA